MSEGILFLWVNGTKANLCLILCCPSDKSDGNTGKQPIISASLPLPLASATFINYS